MAYGENIFTGMIDEQGNIYEASTGRKRQIVGVDSQREQELLNQINDMQVTIDNYYEKLVELGVITPPKTAEEIATEQAAQQSQINQSLLEAINSLKSEIKELRANGDVGCNVEFDIEPNKQNSTSNRKKSTGNQKRTGAGQENTTSNS